MFTALAGPGAAQGARRRVTSGKTWRYGAVASVVLTFWAAPARADVDVVLDQARVLRLPHDVSTVVIGNPAIADVSVQRMSGVVIVTGKTYGSTNMIMLDAGGQTLREDQVVVRAGGERIVTVQRGLERESLTCRPVCERTITMGDAPTSFDAVSSQTASRSGLALGQAAAQAAPVMPPR